MCACVTYDGSIGLSVDGTQTFELHHGFRLLSLLTTSLQVAVEEIHHLQKREGGMRRRKQAQDRLTGLQTGIPAVRQADRYLSAAPGQASGDPVDSDVQVVHLPVVVWSRQVVGAETAEEQSQEEVQQLETQREGRCQFYLL